MASKGALLGPPQRTIAAANRDVLIPQLLCPLLSKARQSLMALYSVDLMTDAAQYGRSVSGARSYFENAVRLRKIHRLRHESDNVGLRYRLLFFDGKRGDPP